MSKSLMSFLLFPVHKNTKRIDVLRLNSQIAAIGRNYSEIAEPNHSQPLSKTSTQLRSDFGEKYLKLNQSNDLSCVNRPRVARDLLLSAAEVSMKGFLDEQGEFAAPAPALPIFAEDERLCQNFAQTAKGGSISQNHQMPAATMCAHLLSNQSGNVAARRRRINGRASRLERMMRSAWRGAVSGARTRVHFWLCCGLLGGIGFLSVLNQMAAQTPDAPASTPAPYSSTENPAPATADPSAASSPSALPSSDSSILTTPQPVPVPNSAPTPANEGTGNLFNDSADQDSSQPATKRSGTGVTVTETDIQRSQADIDQLSISTFQRAQTNAESLYQGVGGVPLPLNPLYFNALNNKETGYIFGPFTIRPILSTGVSYRSTSGDQGNTSSGFYGFVAPTVAITLGEPATGRTIGIQYGGNVSFGSDAASQRVYNQTLSANGTWNFVKLNLGFGVDFSQLSGSDRDFGGQDVNREIVGLSLSGSYIYSEKTNVSANLSAPIRVYGSGVSSAGVTETTFFNYVYSPVTTIGVGFGIGTLEVQNNQSQLFEQILFRASYISSALLTFNGTVGYEFRDAGDREEISPVFGLGLAWQVRESTALSLLAERRILNSAAVAGANFTSTNFSLSVSQRIGAKFQLSGTVGLEDANYESVTDGFSTNRHDVLVILQGNVSAQLSDRWIASVVLSYGKNYSGKNGIDTFQSSLQLSYVF